VRASRLLAIAVALNGAAVLAQEEPPATWDPRPKPPPADAAAPPTAPPTATPPPPPIPTAPPEPAASPSRPRTLRPRLHAGDYRWTLAAGYGAAATGAPSVVVGGGLALGATGGVRVEANVLAGFSTRSRSVADAALQQLGTGDGYTNGVARTDTILFELSGSRRAGGLELWAGGGVHVSFVELEARERRCVGLACFADGPPSIVGSATASGFVLGTGARIALLDHLLASVDLRYLARATATVEDFGLEVPIAVGGASATAGLVFRFGGRVPR
jgi:hypothetical protein